MHSSPPWITNRVCSGVVVVRVVHQWKRGKKSHRPYFHVWGGVSNPTGFRAGGVPSLWMPGWWGRWRGGGSRGSQRHCEAAQGSTAGTRHGEGGPKARGEGRRDGRATPELDRSAPRIGREGAAAVIRTRGGGRENGGHGGGERRGGPLRPATGETRIGSRARREAGPLSPCRCRWKVDTTNRAGQEGHVTTKGLRAHGTQTGDTLKEWITGKQGAWGDGGGAMLEWWRRAQECLFLPIISACFSA